MRPSTFALAATLLVVLLSACASERSTVSDGPLQKRRFRPGWHWDLPTLRNERQAPIERHARAEQEEGSDQGEAVAQRVVGSSGNISDPLAHEDLPAPATVHSAWRGGLREEVDVRVVVEIPQRVPASTPVREQQGSTDEAPKKRWNPWAIPALAVALGTVALGLLTTSTIGVLIGVVIAIVLAAIALKRGREEELAGKGFAIAAMIIAMLTVLATAAAIAVVGFV